MSYPFKVSLSQICVEIIQHVLKNVEFFNTSNMYDKPEDSKFVINQENTWTVPLIVFEVFLTKGEKKSVIVLLPNTGNIT